MAELEKVIRGLGCLSNPYVQDMDERDCENCQYDNVCCFLDVTADALSLLKAQEPRVLALDDVRILIGVPRYAEYYIPVIDSEPIIQAGWVIVQSFVDKGFDEEHFVSFATAYGIMHWHIAAYGRTWRCWTTRPTDEQREAVKWE